MLVNGEHWSGDSLLRAVCAAAEDPKPPGEPLILVLTFCADRSPEFCAVVQSQLVCWDSKALALRVGCKGWERIADGEVDWVG